jgi:hypothetical protein
MSSISKTPVVLWIRRLASTAEIWIGTVLQKHRRNIKHVIMQLPLDEIVLASVYLENSAQGDAAVIQDMDAYIPWVSRGQFEKLSDHFYEFRLASHLKKCAPAAPIVRRHIIGIQVSGKYHSYSLMPVRDSYRKREPHTGNELASAGLEKHSDHPFMPAEGCCPQWRCSTTSFIIEGG